MEMPLDSVPDWWRSEEDFSDQWVKRIVDWQDLLKFDVVLLQLLEKIRLFPLKQLPSRYSI